jgi:hypothetical protein
MLDFLMVDKKYWLGRNFAIKKKYNKRIPYKKVEKNFNNKINNENPLILLI